MANAEHLEILKAGVEVWNRWRAENHEARPELTQADLSGANLIDANLRFAFLNGTRLAGTRLDGAKFAGVIVVPASGSSGVGSW